MKIEVVSLCCWPRTRCPEVVIDTDNEKVIIRGENPETGEPEGEVELDFYQSRLLRELLAGL